MNKLYLFVVFCCMSLSAFGTGYYPSAASIPFGSTSTYCTGTPNVMYTATVTMCGATTTVNDTLTARWYFNNAVIATSTVVPTSSSPVIFTLTPGTYIFNTAGTFAGANGLYLKITTSNTPPGSCAASPLSSPSLPIVVNATPAITGATSVCVGSSFALSGTPTGGTWTSSGTISVTSTGIVTGSSVGTGTVTYTTGSCSTTSPVNVMSSAAFASGTLAVCANDLSDTLKFLPAGGTWSSSNTLVANVSSTTGGIIPVGVGTTIISYTAGTCTSGVILNVVGLPNPITGPLSYCPTGSGTLSSTTSGGTWSSSSTAVATISVAGLVSAVASGTTTISYTSGCSATAVVSVSTTPAPITGGSAVCLGGTITMSTLTAGGTWSSSVPTRGTIDATTGVVGGIGVGTTTINYIAPGCSFGSAVVTVTPAPAAIAGNTGAICPTSTLVLTNSVSGGTWSLGPATVATISPTGIVTAIAAGTAIVTYSIGTGCTVNTVVTVQPGPSFITGPGSVCIGAVISLSNTIGGGTWSTTSSQVNLFPTGSTVGVEGASAGIAIVTYTASGCSTTKLVSVNPNPGPILPLGSVAVCAGFSTSLSNTSPGGTWTATGTATIVATGVVTGVVAGPASITYTLPTGCYITKAISVNPLPTVTGTFAVCQGNTTTLTGAPGGGVWTSSYPMIATVSGLGATSGIVAGGSVGGTTFITYQLASTTGCYATKVVTVGLTPNPIITGPSILCASDTMTLHNSVAGGSWSSTATGTATVGSTTGLVFGVAPGAVTIVYTTPGCNPVGKAMNVLAPPAPITGPSAVCVGDTITLASTTSGGTWSSSDVLRATVGTGSGKVAGISMGTVLITYKLSTLGSCQATKVVTVNPLVAIAGDDTVCAGSITYLTNIVGGGTWASSNTAIGTVDPISGALLGTAPGITFVKYSLPTGCTVSVLVSVLPQQPPITGAAGVCTGSVTTLTNTSSGGIWSSSNAYVGSVGSVSGILIAGLPDTVTITYTKPHACISQTVITVNPLPVPAITLAVSPPPATLSTASYYTSYQWFANGSVIPGATSASLALTTFYATYSVMVTDTNGCIGSSEWKGPVNVQNYNEATVYAYPNPTSGMVHIYAPVAVKAVISGIDGRTIMQQSNATDLDLSNLANGIYMLTLYDELGQKMHTQKLMKD